MILYAIGIGVLIGIFVILRFKKRKLERTRWAYPVFLATFPLYYILFALYAMDYKALLNEIIISILFLVIAYISYRYKNKITLILLSIGYILHAVYDFIHDYLFSNAGIPVWWPYFCSSVDIIMGIYILYFAIRVRKE
ncbi:MAG: hypothetical protein PHO27_09085 [Sulfuricurvum sp.]|nr:hypothetical protein [Sulfuricurvum sp.]